MSSTESGSELLTGSITRRMNGLDVRLKSEPLESLFNFISSGNMNQEPKPVNQPNAAPGSGAAALRDNAGQLLYTSNAGAPSSRPTPTKAVSWGPVRHYLPEMTENGIPRGLPGFSHGRFDMWGSKELILSPRNPRLNFSMLLAHGLGSAEGVKLLIPTVISQAALDSFVEGLNAGVRQLYIDYLKESTTNIRIYTEQFVTTS